MTDTSLARMREHLSGHRRLIISRSFVSAAAGALPIPLVEEWLSSSIKRQTIRRIANRWSVDLDDDAVRAIADGPRKPPEWTEVAGGTLLYRFVSGTWRKLLVGVLAARRAQAAGNTFLIATLFDHYCAVLHVGMGLNAATGAELRAIMGKALEQTSGGLSRHLFRRGAISAARATLRAPVEVADMLSGGTVRRLLSRGSEVEAITEVDESIEKQLAAQDSFLARATLAIELQMSAGENPYLDRLLQTFERLWREHREQTPIT